MLLVQHLVIEDVLQYLRVFGQVWMESLAYRDCVGAEVIRSKLPVRFLPPSEDSADPSSQRNAHH